MVPVQDNTDPTAVSNKTPKKSLAITVPADKISPTPREFRALDEMFRLLSTPSLPMPLRVRLLVEYAQYQHPKLRAIEHSGEIGERVTLTIIGA
ncbi:MAG: hypothetical protein ACRD98_00320 [Nitrososphaera sp.]